MNLLCKPWTGHTQPGRSCRRNQSSWSSASKIVGWSSGEARQDRSKSLLEKYFVNVLSCQKLTIGWKPPLVISKRLVKVVVRVAGLLADNKGNWGWWSIAQKTWTLELISSHSPGEWRSSISFLIWPISLGSEDCSALMWSTSVLNSLISLVLCWTKSVLWLRLKWMYWSSCSWLTCGGQV